MRAAALGAAHAPLSVHGREHDGEDAGDAHHGSDGGRGRGVGVGVGAGVGVARVVARFAVGEKGAGLIQNGKTIEPEYNSVYFLLHVGVA